MNNLTLHTDILSPAQQYIWPLLGELPDTFSLYGDIAVSLLFGHRSSPELSFFSSFNYSTLPHIGFSCPFIKKSSCEVYSYLNISKSDFYCKVYENCDPYIDLNYVKLSLLSNKGIFPEPLEDPIIISDNNLKIFSPRDLFTHKILSFAKTKSIQDVVDITQFLKLGFSLKNSFYDCLDFSQKFNQKYINDLVNIKNYLHKYIYNHNNNSEDIKILPREVDGINFDNFSINTGICKNNYSSISLEDFRRYFVWNDDHDLLYNHDYFLSYIMANREGAYYELVEFYDHTDDDFRRALKKTEPGVFRQEADWRYWHKRLKISPIPALPRKYLS